MSGLSRLGQGDIEQAILSRDDRQEVSVHPEGAVPLYLEKRVCCKLPKSSTNRENHYLHGMIAFGLEQCHRLEEAEEAGRRAVEMNRYDRGHTML